MNVYDEYVKAKGFDEEGDAKEGGDKVEEKA